MAIRPSVIFQFGTGTYGWSERYWHKTQSAPLDLVALNGRDLLAVRMKMMAGNVDILGAYASYDDEFRDVEFISTPTKQDGKWNGAFDAADAKCDMPWTSLHLRCASGVRAGKHIYLAGCPDSQLVTPTKPQGAFTVAFDAAIDKYKLELRKNWAWKGRAYDAAISPISNITDIAAPVGGISTVTVVSTAGFNVGAPVKIKDVVYTGLFKPNRNFRIIKIVDATHFEMGTLGGDPEYQGGGTAQCLNFTLFPITDFTVVGTSNRKRGAGGNHAPLARRPKT